MKEMASVRAVVAVFAVIGCAAVAAAQSTQSQSEVSFNAGLTHLRENRPTLALEQFKKAVKEDPKNAYAYKGLGLTYAQLGKLNDAVAAFRKALELNPYYVDVHNDLGTVLVLAGKRAEGRAEFLAAFNDATNPTPEIAARNLGQAYLEEKNYAEALNWFRTSFTRNKAYADPYLGFSECVLALGRPEEAVAPLEAALKEVPGNPVLLAALGEAYYRAGHFTEARTRLEDAVRRDPVGPAGRKASELLKNFPK